VEGFSNMQGSFSEEASKRRDLMYWWRREKAIGERLAGLKVN